MANTINMDSQVPVRTPLVVIVDSKVADYFDLKADGSLSVSYKLPNGLELSEPHLAKLLYIRGLKIPASVSCSFISQQSVNGQATGSLGSNVVESNVYIPVQSNYIPATGWLKVARLDGNAFSRAVPVSIAFHIVPASYLHCMPCEAQLYLICSLLVQTSTNRRNQIFVRHSSNFGGQPRYRTKYSRGCPLRLRSLMTFST